jgi:hypothetical protein
MRATSLTSFNKKPKSITFFYIKEKILAIFWQKIKLIDTIKMLKIKLFILKTN